MCFESESRVGCDKEMCDNGGFFFGWYNGFVSSFPDTTKTEIFFFFFFETPSPCFIKVVFFFNTPC